MQTIDEWGPWILLRRDFPLPFRPGDHVRIRTFISSETFKGAEGRVTREIIPHYLLAVALCRPGTDWIEVSIRKPRGMKMLQDILENLPVSVIHE